VLWRLNEHLPEAEIDPTDWTERVVASLDINVVGQRGEGRGPPRVPVASVRLSHARRAFASTPQRLSDSVLISLPLIEEQ
jgi:hypothetical protein